MSSLSDGRSAGFLWIDNKTLTYIGEHVGPYGISVYAAIAMHTQGRGRQAFPGKPRIAGICGCSARKVQKTLRELEDIGVLETEIGAGPDGQNNYTLLDAPQPEEEEGGGEQHSRGGGTAFPGGGNSIPPNKTHKTRPINKRGGPAEKSASGSPSLTADAKPLADAFTASGAELSDKRIRILNRWAERGRIDDVQRFARVVERDLDGKGRILSMNVLMDKYREATAKAAERATGGTVSDVHGRGDGAPQAVPHKTAVKVHHHIRDQINGKAKLLDHFDHIGDGDWRPVTATAHSVLSSLSTNSAN